MRLRQNGRHFADNTFKCIFFNENVRILINVSLKFVPKGPIDDIPALVLIMAWRRPGDKTLSEPMMVSLLTYICVTLPQLFQPQNVDPWHNDNSSSCSLFYTVFSHYFQPITSLLFCCFQILYFKGISCRHLPCLKCARWCTYLHDVHSPRVPLCKSEGCRLWLGFISVA